MGVYTCNITTSELLPSRLLQSLDWIEHGFGTRRSQIDQGTMASLKQIHSAEVLVANGPGCLGEGDGVVTASPGIAVSIRTADCFPVLLADVRGRAVAAVHAGWRGTAARIIPATMELMRAQFQTKPGDIYAAIGPGIGQCCYYVGEDVARRFGLTEAGYVDLRRSNRDQLIESGVPEAQIDSLDRCTYCDAARFYSYRRDKDTAGRMVSFIRIRPNGI